MDLRKRLANLDRITRKNNPPKDNKSSSPDVGSEVLEKSLLELQLQCTWPAEDPIWTRDYCDDLNFNWDPLPPLDGFFTRADEADPGMEEVLFLDTETTGLSGGTGTVAFLVGVGWIKGNQFHTRQFFMPDFSHERAMLEEVSALAQSFTVVMTYNGASFDLPLLRTRALMNRLKDPCGKLVSWDLLVPGRRLWNRVFPNCRQQTLEKGLLDLRRTSGDIDGALIPQIWFDFLGTGNGELMGRVLHHNQRDLTGMVGIFSHVLDKARNLQNHDTEVRNWKDAWALGRIAEKAMLKESAAHWMQKAVLVPESKSDGRFVLSGFVADAIRLLKRQGNWAHVENVIKQAREAGLDQPWLHREAAILYEHRIVNLARALDHAQLSMEPGRVQRLEKKILRIGKV